eukprot:TRINITY_DN5033_c0_g1_i11.p1 TRINITY_DN5033_c0_g1~~TRINITY_DN5033_c0_g1_i11.p1  ORF type:complete len:447 (+),score=89.63 TRINITY_DN5033_c0_g1_i11:1723-3063(+)
MVEENNQHCTPQVFFVFNEADTGYRIAEDSEFDFGFSDDFDAVPHVPIVVKPPHCGNVDKPKTFELYQFTQEERLGLLLGQSYYCKSDLVVDASSKRRFNRPHLEQLMKSPVLPEDFLECAGVRRTFLYLCGHDIAKDFITSFADHARNIVSVRSAIIDEIKRTGVPIDMTTFVPELVDHVFVVRENVMFTREPFPGQRTTNTPQYPKYEFWTDSTLREECNKQNIDLKGKRADRLARLKGHGNLPTTNVPRYGNWKQSHLVKECQRLGVPITTKSKESLIEALAQAAVASSKTTATTTSSQSSSSSSSSSSSTSAATTESEESIEWVLPLVASSFTHGSDFLSCDVNIASALFKMEPVSLPELNDNEIRICCNDTQYDELVQCCTTMGEKELIATPCECGWPGCRVVVYTKTSSKQILERVLATQCYATASQTEKQKQQQQQQQQ